MKTNNDCGSRLQSYSLSPDQELTDFARPDYDAAISFGMSLEP